MPAIYDSNFYASQSDRSNESAAVIVPLIVEAVRPASMVDIGCGVGFWPHAFMEHGVEVAYGVDGPWVDRSKLALPEESFIEFDFEKAKPPFHLPLPRSRYDLVTSFEFVEHVDERYADPLIDLFCGLAEVVIVGGAIPYQGGLHHVNERWPAYWAEKFRDRGYEPCDFVRPQVWGADVEPWYAQNTIAYFKGGAPEPAKAIAAQAWANMAACAPSMVHPGMWEQKSVNCVPRPMPLSQRLSGMPRRLGGRAKRAILGAGSR